MGAAVAISGVARSDTGLALDGPHHAAAVVLIFLRRSIALRRAVLLNVIVDLFFESFTLFLEFGVRRLVSGAVLIKLIDYRLHLLIFIGSGALFVVLLLHAALKVGLPGVESIHLGVELGFLILKLRLAVGELLLELLKLGYLAGKLVYQLRVVLRHTGDKLFPRKESGEIV